MDKKTPENIPNSREEKLSSIFRASPVGMGLSAGRVILEANESLCHMTGYSGDEIIGRNTSFLYPTREEYESTGKEVYGSLRQAGAGTAETRWKKKDGSIIDIILNSAALDQTDLTKGVTFAALDITVNKNAEKARAETELSFRTYMEKSPEAIFIADTEGIIQSVNSRATEITGYKIEELFGLHLTKIHTEKEIPLALEKLNEVKRQGKTKSEFMLKKKDGGNVPVLFEAALLPERRIIGYCRDITELKKSQTALRASEAKYRELIELAVDGIMICSMDGEIIEINTQLEKITGKTREQLIGLNMSELFTEESLRQKPVKFEFLGEGKTLTNERVISREDGIQIIVETHSKIMPGGVFQSIFRDITERKRNEESIISEKERLAVTLRSIGDGVITTDREGNILLMNSVAEDLTGWRFSECRGKKTGDIFRIINEFTRAPENDIVSAVIKTGELNELSSDTLLVSRDGSEILISLSVAPIRGIGGETAGVVMVFHDLTEKRKLAESLHRNRKLDSLATLAGGIAHDFNNILSGILGYIELASNYSRNDDELKICLDKAVKVFDRARDLTGQLLTFAHGGNPLIKTENIKPVLREYAASALNGSDIKCVFNMPGDLWLCNFDRTQIGQVVHNIVTNAREFVNSGGQIDICAENIEHAEGNTLLLKPGRYVKVEIRDSGDGIPGDILPHIFDPFFTTKKKGHGLGLATSYSIILRHGGLLDVESMYGKGSRFWFYLPAAAFRIEKTEKTARAEHSGTGIILVMDDENFIREIISQMLKHMGYNVIQSSEGGEMLELYRKYSNDPGLKCIILDLTIPDGMGGRETVAEIRKLDREIPVFASSGYSNDRIMASPEDYGFTDSIRKPFTINELSELLNRHLHE